MPALSGGCLGSEGDARLVGDPVDVVTGANVDRALDFRLDSTPAIQFFRYATSARNKEDAGLGYGHRHVFDVRLLFDVDGMRLELPDGQVATFPFLLEEGAEAAAAGVRITRRGGAYELERRGDARRIYRVERDGRLVLDRLEAEDGTLQLTYDQGRLSSVRASSGHVVGFKWNAEGRLSQASWLDAPDGRNHVLVKYRYQAGALVEGTDAYGHVFSLSYDADFRITRRTDQRGYGFEFAYDAEGRCVRARGQDGVLDVALRYFPVERRSEVQKGDGGVWQYYYTDVGTLLQIIDPYGGVTVFVHDARTGRVLESVDPQGVRTHYEYDAWGGLRALRDAFGVARAPDEKPRPRTHALPEEPLGYACGRLASVAQIALPTAQDWWPGLTQVADASLVRSATPGVAGFEPKYDACHVLVRSERGDGARRRFAYDEVGNLRTYVDADGGVWRYEYASWNHRTRYLSPLGASSAYDYNAAEKLTELVDRGGTRSEYAYDLKDRLVEVRRHGRVRERYVYDTADRQIEKRDGQDRVLVATKRGPGGLASERRLGSGDVHKLKHDARGLLTEAKNEAGTCRFAYDYAERRTVDERDGLGVRHVFGTGRVLETRVLGRFVTRYRSAVAAPARRRGGAVRGWARGDQPVRRRGPLRAEGARAGRHGAQPPAAGVEGPAAAARALDAPLPLQRGRSAVAAHRQRARRGRVHVRRGLSAARARARRGRRGPGSVRVRCCGQRAVDARAERRSHARRERLRDGGRERGGARHGQPRVPRERRAVRVRRARPRERARALGRRGDALRLRQPGPAGDRGCARRGLACETRRAGSAHGG
ncbi:MAG: hypothetical protein RL385_116, partial [Pseudomonadota bacterium]